MERSVGASCLVLGPGTDADRYAGIEDAFGAIAGASVYDGPVMDRAPGLRVIARTGIGYDAHRFASGRRLVLGGVEIPHDRGLAGHSDADVLLHAIADALLGAAA